MYNCRVNLFHLNSCYQSSHIQLGIDKQRFRLGLYTQLQAHTVPSRMYIHQGLEKSVKVRKVLW